MGGLLSDLRYAVRIFRRSPGFAAIAIGTLALGIGANTAIFSVVDAVLLRDLPFRDSSRLVFLFGTSPARGVDQDVTSVANCLDWRKQNTVFDQVGGFDTKGRNLVWGGEPEALTSATVTANWFELMGVRPFLGRGFRPGEDGTDPAAVVVLGHELWKRRFGGDASIVGRAIDLNGEPKLVVGVMPPNAGFPAGADIWEPLPFPKDLEAERGSLHFPVIARLKPGVTLARAQSEMKTIAARLEHDYPKANAGWSAVALPFRGQIVSDYRTLVLLLLGAVGFVLLIACANVANLLLARGAARQREIATRAALGAGKTRLLRQLLTESVVLSFAGAGLGVLAAQAAVGGLVRALPVGLPPWMEPSINVTVLLFTVVATVATGLVFGTLPALQSLRASLVTGLGGAGRHGGVGRGGRAQGALVVSEVALAIVLLSGAGLVVKSLVRLEAVSPGFRPERVVTGGISLTAARFQEPAVRVALASAILDRLRAMPGVESASLSQTLPFSGNYNDTNVRREGEPEPPPAQAHIAGIDSVMPGYFATMGIRLSGEGARDFGPADVPMGSPVAVVNEGFARRFWPAGNPVGKRFVWGSRLVTVIGVARDVRRAQLTAVEAPHFYVPYSQRPVFSFSLVASTRGAPATAVPLLAAAVHAVDPLLPVASPQPMAVLLRGALSLPRFASLVLGAFAVLALLLAALGLYGLLAHVVARRTAEIGVRMAIGAQRADIFALVARKSFRLTAIGLGIGLVAGLALTRLLRGMLFEVGPGDPSTLAGVCVLLIIVAFLATWLPARRATAVSPIEALRQE